MLTEMGGRMVTADAVAVLVGSVIEVAVIVTLLPFGTEAGAVYVVAAPLGLFVGLNDPQLPGLPQVAVQPVPWFPKSFETVAAT